MQHTRLNKIRDAERASHMEAYSANALYRPGSWLAKPVKTVLELLPLFASCREFHALDLGCGVGRNSIPVAQAFRHISCRVDCVDILPFAIEKLKENAAQYDVSDALHGILGPIDAFAIPENSYDLILAISALEHVDSEETFVRKLEEIRRGVRENGAVCMVINCNVEELEKATGKPLPPQFEVNLQTSQLLALLHQVFSGWEVIKETQVHQKYDIPRETGMAELETDVVTYAARRKMQ